MEHIKEEKTSKKPAERKLPLWRILLAILLAVAATALLIYGSAVLTAKGALSKHVIKKVYAEADLWTEYGEDVSKAVNIGISHLTNTPYQENQFVNRELLSQLLDWQTIRTYLIDKTSELATAVSSDQVPNLNASDIVPLFQPVKEYTEKQFGVTLSDELIKAEIIKAIGGDSFDDTKNFHYLHVGGATACLIAGVILLLGVYGASWPKINFAGILCIISCVVLCIALMIVGMLIRKVLNITDAVQFFGTKILSVWAKQASAVFTRRAFLALLGCIAPIVLSVIYTYDRKHVKSIWRKPVPESRS